MKKCLKCEVEKPLSEFWSARPNQFHSRCKSCHGLTEKECVICKQKFTGKRNKILCSDKCRKEYRPQTFLKCKTCDVLFGPVDHKNRQFCSYRCKVSNQSTGITKFHKATKEAARANRMVKYYVDKGVLIRPKHCEECKQEASKIEAAHFNYHEPLRVRWLCKSCHIKWDKSVPKKGTIIVQIIRRWQEYTGKDAYLEETGETFNSIA